MAKIRHIAIRTDDTEGTAAFFQEVFGLEVVQRREHGTTDLSDGDINLTLLPLNIGTMGREVRPGVEHIGFSVEDEAETRERLLAHGASELNPVRFGDVYYEAKFQRPDGLILDVGHWAGASPEAKPRWTGAPEEAKA